jgi:hypothetical protein
MLPNPLHPAVVHFPGRFVAARDCDARGQFPWQWRQRWLQALGRRSRPASRRASA